MSLNDQLSEWTARLTRLFEAQSQAAANRIITDALDKLQAGDLAGLAPAIAYASVPGKYFRSGYVRTRVWRCLRQLPLDDETCAVLRRVVLEQIVRAGPEFKEILKIVPLVRSDEFDEEAAALIKAAIPYVRRRAELVLQGAHAELKVSFDDPDAGWIGMVVTRGAMSFRESFSYTPTDSFSELLTAVACCRAVDGAHKARWNVNPARVDVEFHRTGDQVELRIVRWPDQPRKKVVGKLVFSTRGTFAEVCMPFWRAIRDLQGRFSHEELSHRWHRQFPMEQIQTMARRMKDKPARR